MTLETKLGELPMNNNWKFLIGNVPDRVYNDSNAPAVPRPEPVTPRPAHPSSIGEGHCIYSFPMSISFKAGPINYGLLRRQSDL